MKKILLILALVILVNGFVNAQYTVTITGVSNTSCYGVCDGTATVEASGGATPYIYNWPDGETSPTALYLCAGFHTVTVTDAFGASVTDSVTISQPAYISYNIDNITNASCTGVCDGALEISGSGGVPPYQFLWEGGSTSDSLTDLCAGYYYLTITDSTDCYTSTWMQVNEPYFTAWVNFSPVTCFGGSNGFAYAELSGGNAPFSYLWSTGETNQTINNLSAGYVYLTVTDGAGCSIAANAYVYESSEITVTIDHTDVTCNMYGDGWANVSTYGGSYPHTYLWSNGSTMESIYELNGGTYSVTVTDYNGCTTVNSVTILEPDMLNATVATQNVTCFGGNDGSADLTVTGGTTPYTYSWSNGSATEDLYGLSANMYYINVNDANGCMTSNMANIYEPAQIYYSTYSTNAGCGMSDGSAWINLENGVPPFDYYWSNGGTTDTITGVAAGAYFVTVTDSTGCQVSAYSNVSNAGGPYVMPDMLYGVSCFGGSDGVASVYVNGGTPSYTYNWSNGSTSSMLNGLSAGIYSVTVTDAANCLGVQTVNITEPTLLSIDTIYTFNVHCFGQNDGGANAIVTGGMSPYQFAWSNGSNIPDAIYELYAGYYDLTVTDHNGCTATKTFTVAEPPELTGTITRVNTSCFANCDGQLNIEPSGGIPPYNIFWNIESSSQTIWNLCEGSYYVTITDSLGCQFYGSDNVYAPSELIGEIGATNVSCHGLSDGAADLVIEGGTPPYSFYWNTGAETEDLYNIPAGNYYVNVYDSMGCYINGSTDIYEPAAIVLSAMPGNADCGMSNAYAEVYVDSGGAQPFSYAWSSGDNSMMAVNLAAGVYTVTVTDITGCHSSLDVIINNYGAPAVEPYNITAITCNGYNDGMAAITVIEGGTPPYTYNWSNGDTTENVSGLAQGLFYVTVTDSLSCAGITSLVITEPDSISLRVMTYDVYCAGDSSGMISANPSGGTYPYTLLWSTGSNLQEGIYSLAGGVYSVTLTDNNGCTADTTVIINEPDPLLIESVYVTNISCTSNDDGSVMIIASGGTPEYYYSLGQQQQGEYFTMDSLFTGLWEGYYNVILKDKNDCYALQDSIFVNEPDPIEVVSVDYTNASCAGYDDGSLAITGAGGTPPYMYSLDHGGSFQQDSIFWGLVAGVYDAKIIDISGCYTYYYTPVEIMEPPQLEIAVAIVTDAHCGQNDGSASMSVSGGTPLYSYNWSNGSTLSALVSAVGGNYTVTVTDSHGCTSIDSVQVGDIPAGVASIPVFENNFCPGQCTAYAEASIDGGFAPYTFAWSSGESTAMAYNLCSGMYSVTITDSMFCVSVDSIMITEPSSISITAVSTPSTCFGTDNAALDATVTGGTLPYSFVWSNGENTEDIAGLVPGNYNLEITDANGCMDSASFMAGEPALLTGSIASTDILCNGSSDGSLNLTVSGGTIPYSFNWSTGETTEDISNLAPGTYYVSVFDANDCIYIDSSSISEPDSITVTYQVTDVMCFGSSTGVIDLTVTGGSSPYTFGWSNGATLEDLVNIPAGVYYLTITDNNGCTQSGGFTVSQSPEIAITLTAFNPLCFGTLGSASALVTGGVQPYTYLWSNGVSGLDSIYNLTPAVYGITVMDAYDCTVIDSVAITAASGQIVPVITVTDVLCSSGSAGAIDLAVSGGISPYTYLWSNGITLEDLTNLPAGGYSVTITDANGCSETVSGTVGQNSWITTSIYVSNPACFGMFGAATVSPASGLPPFSYLWSNGNTDSTASYLSPGFYTVTVTDANNCMVVDSIIVDSAPSELSATVTGTDASCNGDCDATGSVSAMGGVSPYMYHWSNGINAPSITNLCATSYQVTVTDSNACTYTQTLVINAQPMSFLMGAVHYSGGVLAQNTASVELYTDLDTDVAGYDLVDIIPIGVNGNFEFMDLSSGIYYLRAVLTDTVYPLLIPTYFSNTYPDSAYMWQYATPVSLSCNSTLSITINMYELPVLQQGEGTISGTITIATFNKSILGEPVPGAEVTLEQEPDDDPIANTTTNGAGGYSFTDLPDGTFSLAVDIPGMPQFQTYQVEIGGNDTSYTNLNFVVDTSATDSAGIYVDHQLTRKKEIANLFSVAVYPNPFGEEISMEYTLNKNTQVNIAVFDIAGKKITTIENKNQSGGTYHYAINASENGMTPGVYFIRMQVDNAVYIKKITRIE